MALYKNITLLIYGVVVLCTVLPAQHKLPAVYLNHLYIVLDSNTYNKIVDSSYLTQYLGNIKVSAQKTSHDAWTGKYFYGANGYFEFFSTEGYKNAVVGDCGFGFMTTQMNDIWKIEKYWKQNSKDSIERDTTFFLSGNASEPWFYSLSLLNADSVQPLNTWLMENTPEELKATGFSEIEIKAPITWQAYAEKRAKKAFTKSFNRITAVELSINKNELDYLEKSLLGLGLKKNGNVFSNEYIKIQYSLDERFAVRLKKVHTSLTKTLPDNNIIISNQLTVSIHANEATWAFKYE